MDAYLLDTNIVISRFVKTCKNHTVVVSRLRALRDTGSKVLLPVIAIAEIEFGLVKRTDSSVQEAVKIRRFFSDYPLHLPIDDNTVEPYSLIRAEIFRIHGTPTRSGRGVKEKLPEELFDRVAGKRLGIDERDLLIASIAVQHNLVLVTNDKNEGMRRIRQAADTLCSAGKPAGLRVEHWC